MKNREVFAVTLRNSKRQETILSKRKLFMQSAFQRTVGNTQQILGGDQNIEAPQLYDADAALNALFTATSP